MTYSTNYRTVPIEQKPEKEGPVRYGAINKKGQICGAVYSHSTNTWFEDYVSQSGTITHYLLPVPDSAVVTREELEKIAGEAWDAAIEYYDGLLCGCNGDLEEEAKRPDKQTFIDQLNSK